MLFKKLTEDLKDAIKAINKEKTEALRLTFSQIKNEAINNGDRENISDELVLAVLKKRVKQGKDAIEQFKKATREDLVLIEEKQLKFLEPYLPKTMSSKDIEKIIRAKIKELEIKDKSKIGQLIGFVMKDLAGHADGNTVRQIATKLLS